MIRRPTGLVVVAVAVGHRPSTESATATGIWWFRAVATRFDKLADRYQATITIADIFIWLRARPDQPRGDPRNTP
jgi:hypothetical protein